MRKGKFSLVLCLGVALVAISFFIVVVFLVQEHIGTNKIRATLAKMEELLPERCDGVPGTYSNLNMPVLQIDGVDYVALLEISSLRVSLPVADKWERDKLFYSPARFCGSAYDHTLVIGGMDGAHQFGFCDEIDRGTLITITDMTGSRFTYKVDRVDRAKNADNTWLTGSDYPLTLYCRDTYSLEYIAVRCDFVYH